MARSEAKLQERYNVMNKFAVFDIDGTLYRWQLYHELFQTLALKGVFSGDVFNELDEQWNKWRSGDVSFDEYEHFVVTTMVKNLPDIPLDAFDAACDTVVEQSQHKTHHFPRHLLKDLQQKGYVTIAITGSQQELIERFGKHYDFDIVIGAVYERKDNHFTGVLSRSTIGKKAEILNELIVSENLTFEGSYAIGDSDGDASLLELVERPIAFNPSEGLFERAKAEGWSIVLERKNIAYRMEKKGDELVLAETIVY